MAITTEQIRIAVEQYLPQTPNFSVSADLGEKNTQAIFERVMQVVLTALLFDEDAVFRITHLSSRRLAADLRAVISLLEQLRGEDLLKALRPDDPVAVSSTQELRRARLDLLRLSGSLAATGQFNAGSLSSFEENLTEFLTDQIKPNVKRRNRIAVSNEIRVLMETLRETWAALLVRRQQVLDTFPNYETVDLSSLISRQVVSAVNAKLFEVENNLSAWTLEEFAEQSEQVMIDLAAAQSALQTVSATSEASGTVIIEPNSSGYTEATWLRINSTASTEPVLYVLKGSGGRLYIDFIVSGTGSALNDADGDATTPTLQDLTATFVDDGVIEDMHLVFADTGRSHRIAALTNTTLTLSPEIPIAASNQRYVVMAGAPGLLFEDLGASFWDLYTNGSTPTTVFASGTQGTFVRDEKATGSNITNKKAAGTHGEFDPILESGTTGEAVTSTLWRDTSATFLSSNIRAPGRLVVIVGANSGYDDEFTLVNSETSLTVSTAFSTTGTSGETYHIRYDNGTNVFRDTFADFLAFEVSPIAAEDALVITSGAAAGTYEIDDVLSDIDLTITTTESRIADMDWYILPADPAQVFLPNADLIAKGVVAGDFIYIGGTVDDIFEIASVDGPDQLTLTEDIVTGFDATTYAIFSDGVNTSKFVQGDGVDFTTAVLPTQKIRIGGIDRVVDRVISASTLYITASVAINLTPASWNVRTADTTYTLEDLVDSPFEDVVGGEPLFSVGDEIVINPGPSELRTVVAEIVSASEITLEAPYTYNQIFSYAHIPDVHEGMELIAAGQRRSIKRVVNDHRLELTLPLSGTIGINVPYFVVQTGTPLQTSRIVDSEATFSEGAVGEEIQLMLDQPRSATILNVVDSATLDLSISMQAGLRDIAYRVLSQIESTTSTFKADDLTGVNAQDYLTVWGLPDNYEISQITFSSANVNPLLPSGLEDQWFVVTRAGSKEYGRYVLFDHLASSILLAEDTDSLRLKVAETLIDYGSSTIAVIASGVNGTLPASADSKSAIFKGSGFSSVAIGDRLRASIAGTEFTSYVDKVDSNTQLTISPRLPSGTATTWEISRTSISFALVEIHSLLSSLNDLLDIVENYTSPGNTTIDAVISLLSDQQMDRAIDLFLDGKLTEFISMKLEDASYTSKAKAAIAVAGSSTRTSEAQAENVAGLNPITGKPGNSGTSSTGLTNNSSTGSGYGIPEEVDAVVDLSSGAVELAADERVRAAAETSLEESRNRAIYELTGEITSSVVTDTDPTLPWISITGSRLDRVTRRAEKMKSALQYIIDNANDFSEATE